LLHDVHEGFSANGDLDITFSFDSSFVLDLNGLGGGDEGNDGGEFHLVCGLFVN
tara:strand:- start:133 stop:294 length:162 start_codon:yes stop_codon:yes gene_type:complete